jgi:guanosine-3',5'-bis(diphosphate) 3'-pyrophosphohydrolase
MELSTSLAVYTKSVDFAARKHRDQRRLDGHKTPYINHPIGVAFILTSEGGIADLSVLQAAILHDTVEDTDTSFDEIEAEFGKEVRGLVEEVSALVITIGLWD